MKILSLKEYKLFKPKQIVVPNDWNYYYGMAMFSDDNMGMLKLNLKDVIKIYTFSDETFLVVKNKSGNYTIKVLTKNLKLKFKFK
jgi:hypothetical protein